MPERTATATWHGSLTDGDGVVTLDSGVWEGRFGTPERPDATDPEDLLAAAHLPASR
jgi:osmotically inducible protein OsmC